MPVIRLLPNKPLVEAIFEFRWNLGADGDPYYTLFVGKLYDRVSSEYPFYESLPAAMVPPNMAKNIVQHRFRRTKEGWPLVQVGPAVITVNDTEGYSWTDFGQRTKSLVESVYEVHPDREHLKADGLVLRYMDAFGLGANEDTLAYISSKLKTQISFPAQLFLNASVSKQPRLINLAASFPIEEPKGNISVRLVSGQHENKPAILMETTVTSEATDLPALPREFASWAETAHVLTDDWFFKFVDGELLRGFLGE